MKTLWVFDNDGTLYDDSSAEKEFMELLADHFSLTYEKSPEEILEEVAELRTVHKTTSSILALHKARGLSLSAAIEATYMRLDLEKLGLKRNPELLRIISNLPGDKMVLTNNPSCYATKALRQIGILECFKSVVGMEELGLELKPSLSVFRKIDQMFPGYDRKIFIDDRVVNLDAARLFGWITVLFSARRIQIDPKTLAGHIVVESLSGLSNLR